MWSLAFAAPIEEVVVHQEEHPWTDPERGEREPDASPTTGVYTLTRRDLESNPGSMEDIARATHNLPGVVSDGDLFAGFHVRGGEQADVVFVLDRVPLENPFHLAGFNSLFNPDMLDTVKFYASAPPAEVAAATSAVMDVTMWSGRQEPGQEANGRELSAGKLRRMDVDGAIDISAASARGFLDVPLHRNWSVGLAARRTYLEGPLAIMEALNIVDTAFVAPGFDELSLRLVGRPHPRHRLKLTVMRAADRLVLADSDDESLFTFGGSLEVRGNLLLTSLDHRYRTNKLTWQTTVAGTRDKTLSERVLERDTLLDDRTLMRAFARTDLTYAFSRNATVKLGVDLSRFHSRSDGLLQDRRAFPTWTQAGIGSFGFQVAEVQPEPRGWTEANGYVQSVLAAPFSKPVGPIQPGIRLRTGVRVTYAGLQQGVLPSPRAGLSIPLPTGTVPKVSLGLYQKVHRDLFQRSEGFGNSDLGSERARHFVVGFDQGIPLGKGNTGLVRVEGYDIALTDLVVNPDNQAAVDAGTSWTQDGSGYSRGLDVMVALRGGRVNLDAAYGLLYTGRVNPLNERFPTEVTPPQDQRHTFHLNGDVAWKRWRFTGGYSFHTGRPVSEVELQSREWESIRLSCLNCSRIGPTHNLDLRAEWRRSYKHHRLTFYLEVLNVGSIRSRFLPIHSVDDTRVLTSWFNHLPMRPFLGIRSDF